MRQKNSLALLAATLALTWAAPGLAQDVVKVGMLVPMTGPFTPTGKQLVAGAKLYMQRHGDTVAGKKIVLIVKDDTGNPDMTKRLAQEFVVRDKVAVLAGFGLTPGALATAPIATEAKVPQIVMMAATSVVTTRSPYIVRTSFSVPQTVVPLADWAAKNGIKKVVTVVSDYAPGIDVETAFKQRFEAHGGKVVESLRVPLASNDFAPALQRVVDAKPDALMGFVPAGVGPIFIRQFVERGLDKSGIKFIAEGSLTEDDIVNQIGNAALGLITTQHYSAAHNSPENKSFVADFKTTEKDLETIKVWDEHALQLAAYRHGIGAPTARCAIVYVNVLKPGEAKVLEIPEEELQRGWKMFRALRDFWYARTGLGEVK